MEDEGGQESKHLKSSWRGSSLKDVEPRDRSMLDHLDDIVM